MGRCTSCNAVIAKTDVKCYVCGEAIPGREKPVFGWFKRPEERRAARRADEAKARILHQHADSTRV